MRFLFSSSSATDHVISRNDVILPRDSLPGTPVLPWRPLPTDVDQPNIDLQVTLTQHWHGLSTLLIDVAPHWLVVNECDVELTIVETNGRKWKIPAGKTFAPPVFSEVKNGMEVGLVRNTIALSWLIVWLNNHSINLFLKAL